MNEKEISYEETLTTVQDYLQLEENNLHEYPAHLRDTFLKAEQEYFIYLVTTDNVISKLIKECNKYDVATLQRLIEEIATNMELGLIEEKDEQRYEDMLIVLTAAIRDKQKRLVLEKIHHELLEENLLHNNTNELGRSR